MKFQEFIKKPVVLIVGTALAVSVVFGGYSFISKNVDISFNKKDDNVLIQQDVNNFNNPQSDTNVDEVYNVIKNNVKLTANEFIEIEVIKEDGAIVINYNINEEYTQFIAENGFTEADIQANVPNMQSVYQVIQKACQQLGVEQNCPIYMVLRDSNDNVFIIIENGEVMEANTLLGKSAASDDKSEAKKETKKEVKKETKKEQPKATCIYCNGPLKDTDKKSVCSDCKNDPMAPSKGKHMESTAPYGRCPSCNGAHASDKKYQGGYCDDCFGKIKEEEYREKHQYGDCVDCGVYLTKNQAQSYGGRCPDCYARYYGDNDTNMGSCDRCGDRVDLDHTNDGWGYSHLCSACTGELQMQESQQDATPWAG